VLFTDGLLERRGRPFVEQMERLAAIVVARRDTSVTELADAILDRLIDDAATDDAVLVVKRFEPELAPVGTAPA
jgi:serine phosphatase RsbU (regulator of sigma subunit)